MLPNEKYENIERYVNQEMTEAEAFAFETALTTDEELAQNLALYQDLPQQLQNLEGQLDFNQKLKAAAKNYQPPKTDAPKSNLLKWGILVSVALLLGLFLWNKFSPVPEEEAVEQPPTFPADIPIAALWEQTEKPTANILRGGETVLEAEKQYQAAHQQYLQKDYAAALATLKKVEKTEAIYAKALLLTGVCEYEQGNFAVAIKAYDVYFQLEKEPQDMALWYQALAYLQTQQFDKAKINLQRIIKEDYNKAKEAKNLLKQL